MRKAIEICLSGGKVENLKIKPLILVIVFVLIGLNAGIIRSEERSLLRFLTINVWSGLDYEGTFRMGEYESKEVRSFRGQNLLSQIRNLDPDVIFIQEANPAAKYSSKLAKALGFDKVHQVCMAGIKFGPIGIPINFKEGMAILARPSLQLSRYAVWKLSGSFGLYGDPISFHFGESIFAVVGKIIFKNNPLYLVNVHMASSPPEGASLSQKFKNLKENKEITEDEYRKGLLRWESKIARRSKEVKRLKSRIAKLPKDSPVIVAGDFNDVPESPAIRSFKEKTKKCREFFDTFALNKAEKLYSWDPSNNKNISYSACDVNAKNKKRRGDFRLDALGANIPRRIDYIFLDNHFKKNDVKDCRIVLDTKDKEILASDHYGVMAEVRMDDVLKTTAKEFKTVTPLTRSKFEFLPILMYDTDVGFGYGAKFFYLNPFKGNESLDLVLFNSSKGQSWVKLVFSLPDFERRQGKTYPLSLDITIDYSKRIANSFFGIGSDSDFDDREYYTREPLDLNIVISRGFSAFFVGRMGARYKTISNYNFQEDSRLLNLEPEINWTRAYYTSLFFSLSYDTRNSFINPSKGLVVLGEAEHAPKTGLSNAPFSRVSFWLQSYYELFFPKTVLALRLGAQSLFGENLPVQLLLPMGGSNTLRGIPQDRFLGKASAVFNAEIRFPVFWRLGAVLGYDAGKVWDSLSEVDLTRWSSNPTVGLRLYMDTFVVRVDVGFGKRSTGFYFDFGHVF